MKVYICSPLKGDIEENIRKAKSYMRKIALQGDIPICSHLLADGVLDDTNEEERSIGMQIGMQLLDICDALYIFGNVISEGMLNEIRKAYFRMGIYRANVRENNGVILSMNAELMRGIDVLDLIECNDMILGSKIAGESISDSCGIEN